MKDRKELEKRENKEEVRKTVDETGRNEGKKIMEGRVWMLIFLPARG